jgi:hypothetical protein
LRIANAGLLRLQFADETAIFPTFLANFPRFAGGMLFAKEQTREDNNYYEYE